MPACGDQDTIEVIDEWALVYVAGDDHPARPTSSTAAAHSPALTPASESSLSGNPQAEQAVQRHTLGAIEGMGRQRLEQGVIGRQETEEADTERKSRPLKKSVTFSKPSSKNDQPITKHKFSRSKSTISLLKFTKSSKIYHIFIESLKNSIKTNQKLCNIAKVRKPTLLSIMKVRDFS